jgi:hypothetical protein
LYDQTGDVDGFLTEAPVTIYLPPEEEVEIETWLDYTSTLTATEEITPRIEIASVGPMVLDGTALILRMNERELPGGERHIVIVLSDTVLGLQAAVERLLDGDLEGCILLEGEDELALCSTGELEEGEGTGGWPKPDEEEEEDWEGGVGAVPASHGGRRPG